MWNEHDDSWKLWNMQSYNSRRLVSLAHHNLMYSKKPRNDSQQQ